MDHGQLVVHLGDEEPAACASDFWASNDLEVLMCVVAGPMVPGLEHDVLRALSPCL